jgi:hypothetical protein
VPNTINQNLLEIEPMRKFYCTQQPCGMKGKSGKMLRATQVIFLSSLVQIRTLVCEKYIEMFQVYK